MKVLWFLSFILFQVSDFSFAQKIFTLEIKPALSKVEGSKEKSEIISKISYKKSFITKAERDREIQNVLFSLYDNAYLTVEVESPSLALLEGKGDSLNLVVYVNPGEQYKWANLKRGNIEEGVLREVSSPLLRRGVGAEAGKPFYYKEIRKLQEKILSYCENNGYPFASIKLDSVTISGNSLSAVLCLQKNNLIKVDSVVNRGKAEISEVFLQSYLSIRKGDLYNESLMRKVGTRIKELPFVGERIPYRILFTEENAKVELFLEKKRASQFDGILGLLPDNKTGKVLFTGDVHLKLNNSFNRGEQLELNWRSLQAGSQDLKSGFVFPFLFKTPFGIDATFKLYKKDSTYLEVNPNFGIQYHLSGGNYFKVFINRRQMELISTKNIYTLPPYADITSSLYGISLKTEKLDYRLNPRKGYSFLATASAGNKIIKKNDKLNKEIYDGLTLRSAQYNAELQAEVFIPLKNRSAIKIGSNSAYLKNATLFKNELFRIGGLKTLRGFDEESIPVSAYSVFTLEYRYLFEENSYLYFFGDGAYYENQSISYIGDRYDTPFGFGAGISFETKAGIFSISYALGKQFDNPINLKAGKVHFGIVNYF